MKKIIYFLIAAIFISTGFKLVAQESDQPLHPTLITKSVSMIEVPSIASQIANGTFKPAENIGEKEFNPKHWGHNTSVPGKGLPKGMDPLWENQMQTTKAPASPPSQNWESANGSATPTDPTGAVGPNHYVNAWNTSFRIWSKTGTALTPVASLGTLLPGTEGDPIVIYDPFADRFLITEFYTNGFYVAVSKTADPVTGGWWVYTFPLTSFPDYPKFSVWSDGYYITANKDQSSPQTSQVVFALERDKMLNGTAGAQMLGFPLAGIVNSGFYSPIGFNANGPTPPLPGNAPIVYMQDDSWSGVTSDHLKIWSINVNWTTPASSTISAPQVIPVTAFDGLFDAGSFSNLPQPSGGSDMDALQATIMFMAQYQRFTGYNTVVFNFVVDLNGADNYAGIRWYELRQTTDGQPWTIYQEGTYSAPGGRSAFAGNMCMDRQGNIALGYTSVSTSAYPSLCYTGRNAGDPLGTMTQTEYMYATGTAIDPSSRYGDYSQMTLDPSDQATFWSTGEYFITGGGRRNQVCAFQIAPPVLTAQFAGTPLTICAGGTVNFTDNSLASPTTWAWSFPGGTPSTSNLQIPPAITYLSAGTYDVSLTVGDGTTTDSEVKTGYVTVKNIISDFSGTPTAVVVGNSVTFTDLASCSPDTWAWSFPGGSPSTYSGKNPPAITYSTLGTYDVSLTVTNAAGSDVKTRTGYIVVAPPVFNMTNGTITTCTGDFYDSGGPTGQYASSEVFVETFYPSTPGSMIRFNFTSFDTELNYDTLTIYNGINSSATLIGKYHGTTGPGIVTASNASGALTFRWRSDGSVVKDGWAATITCYSTTSPPVADFSASTVSATVGQTVTFTDLSANYPSSWAWSFSPATVSYVGGTSATSQNPQVQFGALGQYTVTLTATNGYGSDPETKTNYISVIGCLFKNLPFTESFTATTLPVCWTQVDNQGSGEIWKFGTITTPTPVPTLTGNYAYLNSDGYGSGHTQNADLITPTLDLTFYTGVTLAFSHYFRSYSGSSGTLSYSINNGSTWTQISQYTTTTANPAAFSQVITAVAGKSQVKFKWNYTGTWGYFWGIDNLSITGTSTIPTTQTLQNVNVTGSQCANAVETISVAGSGTYFTVQSGGVSNLVAGLTIHLYTGTTVFANGYLHGRISGAGDWCTTPYDAVKSGIEQAIQVNNGQQFYRIFPNPTTGAFTIEMNDQSAAEKWKVEVYDMNGQKMLSNELKAERNHKFSLSGKPSGIYLIRVISEQGSGTSRIILQK